MGRRAEFPAMVFPMNDPLEPIELERMLARRPLTPPPARMDDRMAELFASVGRHEASDALSRRFAIKWVRAVRAIAACGALAALLWLMTEYNRPARRPSDAGEKGGAFAVAPPVLKAAAPPPAFNPVRIEQVWSDVRPEGVVMVDGDPLRRYHRQTVQRVQLIDEKTNVRIEYTVPHDEVVVTPVKYD
jgi:hypothetical protein